MAGGLGLSSQGRSSSKNVKGACLILIGPEVGGAH